MTNEKRKYIADIAIPPGETLLETIESLGMTQAELAERMGMAKKTINEIIKGTAPITPETALKLESVLGAPARFWMNLEANYQEAKAKIKAEKAIKDEMAITKEIPYFEMAKHGWIEVTRDDREKVINSRKYFSVSSLHLVSGTMQVAFRKVDKDTTSPYAIAAWLRKGEIEAAKIDCEPFNKDTLQKLIPKFRSLTKKDPEVFVPQLRELLASCGVALVIEPHLSKTYVNGATKWLSKDKVLLQLSLRCSFADIFWFSFFHELGHIIKHNKKEVFIEKSRDRIQDTLEEEADQFASNTLIPQTLYRKFINSCSYSSRTGIVNFAEDIDVAPFVVIGRMQHDGIISYSEYSNMRTRFCFSKE